MRKALGANKNVNEAMKLGKFYLTEIDWLECEVFQCKLNKLYINFTSIKLYVEKSMNSITRREIMIYCK